jgi:hypothetical protein
MCDCVCVCVCVCVSACVRVCVVLSRSRGEYLNVEIVFENLFAWKV